MLFKHRQEIWVKEHNLPSRLQQVPKKLEDYFCTFAVDKPPKSWKITSVLLQSKAHPLTLYSDHSLLRPSQIACAVMAVHLMCMQTALHVHENLCMALDSSM